MKEEIRLTFYLDNRRKKAEGTYPVKLRLYQPRTTKERLYRTGYDLSEQEFNQGYLKKDPEQEKNRIKGKDKKPLEIKILKLDAVKTKADEILSDLKEFNFDEFEKRFFNKSNQLDVCNYFEDAIQKMKKEGRVRTAETYTLAKNKLVEFANLKRKKPLAEISFEMITPDFLRSYESWMQNVKKHSESTIGIYIRPLRTVFNTAIADRNSGIKADLYPFGQKRYTPPTGQNVKKALSPYQLKLLFDTQPENEFQAKAKEFWFFSYLANGINFKDIAELKFGNLKGNRIAFYRAKTKSKTKATPVLIQAILPEYALNVIKKHGKIETLKGEYIFDILSPTDTPELALRKLKAFTRFVNQHVKKLAESYNNNLRAQYLKAEVKEPPKEELLIPEEISTYWARHTFTTQAIRKGATMELLQESLGHKNMATTQNYFAGFTSDVKEKLSESLLDF